MKFADLTDEDINFLKAHTINESAEKFGIGKSTSCGWYKRLGVNPKGDPNSAAAKSYFGKLTEEDIEYLKTHTINESAEKFNVNRCIVYKWCEKLGIEFKRIIRLGHLTEEDIEFLKTHTVTESAEKFNVSWTTANNWYRKSGIKPKMDPKNNRAKSYINKFTEEDIEFLKTHTVTESAKKFNVNRNVLYRWYKKLGIKHIMDPNNTYTNSYFHKLTNDDIEFIKAHTAKESMEKFNISRSVINIWCKKLGIKFILMQDKPIQNIQTELTGDYISIV